MNAESVEAVFDNAGSLVAEAESLRTEGNDDVGAVAVVGVAKCGGLCDGKQLEVVAGIGNSNTDAIIDHSSSAKCDFIPAWKIAKLNEMIEENRVCPVCLGPVRFGGQWRLRNGAAVHFDGWVSALPMSPKKAVGIESLYVDCTNCHNWYSQWDSEFCPTYKNVCRTQFWADGTGGMGNVTIDSPNHEIVRAVRKMELVR